MTSKKESGDVALSFSQIDRKIGKLVAKSLSNNCDKKAGDSIHFLTRKRAKMMSKPPQRKKMPA